MMDISRNLMVWAVRYEGGLQFSYVCKMLRNFKSLEMGMTKENVIKAMGKPSNIKSVGEYGEVFEYDDTN